MRADAAQLALVVALAAAITMLDQDVVIESVPTPTPSPARPDVATVEAHRVRTPLPHGRDPESARELAMVISESRGWHAGDEWVCLDALWQAESGWRWDVASSTDDHGIPQAHGPAHPETTTKAWRDSPAAMIRWGLRYIEGRYGTPCRAWEAWQERAALDGSGWY